MADLVTISIDGQPIQVPKGALVIEAATQLGIDVPRFCYHPKLSAVGMCRMCLGEVGMPKMNPDRTPALNEDGTPQIAMMPKPQTLCTTQASPGMVILTETPAVVKMREGVLEFFLANHPLDCPICDKGGECMLQDQTMTYARPDSRVQDLYAGKKDLDKNYKLSELITLDRERCIQCARCTRFQDEIAQDPVIELVARGSKTMIDTLSDPPFDSKFSGNTIDICPVGALTSRAFRFRARVWELKNTPTVSMIDGSGTNIFVSSRNETLVRIIPRDNEAINECWISDRDRFGLDYVDNDARLTFPLVRRDGRLEAATWDEALQLVADKLKAAQPNEIGAIGGPKLTNEGALAMSKLFKENIGTPNVDAAFRPQLATPGQPPNTFYEELETADVILLVGTNPNEELPILDLRLKKTAFQRKAHLINCNTAKTPYDKLAKQSLTYNAGTEIALLNAMAKLLHQSWAAEPAQSETLQRIDGDGGGAWIDSLAPYTSSHSAALCGVDESTLRDAATALADAKNLFILVGEDQAPEVLQALQNLAQLKGRSDYLVVTNHGANAAGCRRAGLVPGTNGQDGEAMLHAAANGALKVLYVAANNPLNQARDRELAQRAIAGAGFVVVQTLFENELTAHADVVLPAATFLEQDGSTTNFAGKVQSLKAAFRPRERRDDDGTTLSACAPDWMIFAKLAQLLGHDWNIRSAQSLTGEFKKLPKALPAGAAFTPVTTSATAPSLEENAFALLCGPLLYDGGESFEYCERLKRVVPQPYIAMHRNDARRMGIANKDWVQVQTSRGVVRVKAKVGRDVKPGTLWMPRRLRDVHANTLLAPDATWASATVHKIAPPNEEAVLQEDSTPEGVPLVAPAPANDPGGQ
jgi:NADH-quinone oxidoreductase subunit G